MSPAEDRRQSAPAIELPLAEWEEYPHLAAYECRFVLCPEQEGGFSAHCLNLPGVISQGDNEAEAIENIIDAFRETILYYRGSAEAIPWVAVAGAGIFPDGIRKQVVVKI